MSFQKRSADSKDGRGVAAHGGEDVLASDGGIDRFVGCVGVGGIEVKRAWVVCLGGSRQLGSEPAL
jgi:hypothetical protein